MKKFFTSLIFIVAFATYGLYQYTGNSNTIEYAASKTTPAVPTTQSQNTVVLTNPPPPTPTPKQTQTRTQTRTSSPVSMPPATMPMKKMGQYADGTYIGSVADAYYGNVQVQATISGGKITDVTFLQHPNDRSTSRYINSMAMPVLRSEAIQIQKSNVDTVSGASETSGAFRESLGSALAQAKN